MARPNISTTLAIQPAKRLKESESHHLWCVGIEFHKACWNLPGLCFQTRQIQLPKLLGETFLFPFTKYAFKIFAKNRLKCLNTNTWVCFIIWQHWSLTASYRKNSSAFVTERTWAQSLAFFLSHGIRQISKLWLWVFFFPMSKVKTSIPTTYNFCKDLSCDII
jgi:hypothetical protein